MLALRLPTYTTWILLLCLAAPRVWADDSAAAPSPVKRAAQPARAGTSRPKVSRGTTTVAFQPTLADSPSGTSGRGAPSEELPAQGGVGDISPDELFPAVEQREELTGINPLSLPIKVEIESACPDDDQHEMAPATGMTLSSGRWFNRGCWYAKEDFVYLERSERGRHKRILATEFDPTIATTTTLSGFGDPPALPSQTTTVTTVASPFTTSLPFGSTGNYLPISPSLGFSPGARLTVGAYLGTDAMNRDSAIEFTFQGLNNWSQQGSITAFQPNQNTIFTNFVALPLSPTIPTSAPGFAFSNFQQYTYNASFNSYELNFKLTKRMGRDRSVLTREGIWARVATPQVLPSLYGGLRLVRYNEAFYWRSLGTDPSMVAGNYNITTHNALFGPQFGGGLTYQHENWRFSGRLGGGALANYGDQHSMINGFDTPTHTSINTSNSNNNTTLSLMGDFGLNAVYLFRPNMGLRFGYQIMVLSNLALAERQITFLNFNPSVMNQDHGLYFQGLSSGLEFTW